MKQGQRLTGLLHNIQSKKYRPQNRTYNQQSLSMHKHVPKQRQPFLDKFQGKKNMVSKEGLLQLLQHQLESINHKLENHRQRSRGPLQKLQPLSRRSKKEPAPMTEPHKEKKSTEQLISRQSNVNSHNIQGRYSSKEDLRQLKSQQLINKVKLPSINKSSSLSTQRNRARGDIVNAEITGTTELTGKYRVKSNPKKTDKEGTPLSTFARKMELDSYAIRHLQFLDKFQQQLLHNDVVSKRTAKSLME